MLQRNSDLINFSRFQRSDFKREEAFQKRNKENRYSLDYTRSSGGKGLKVNSEESWPGPAGAKWNDEKRSHVVCLEAGGCTCTLRGIGDRSIGGRNGWPAWTSARFAIASAKVLCNIQPRSVSAARFEPSPLGRFDQ